MAVVRTIDPKKDQDACWQLEVGAALPADRRRSQRTVAMYDHDTRRAMIVRWSKACVRERMPSRNLSQVPDLASQRANALEPTCKRRKEPVTRDEA
jgi:hypothetical protein